MSKPTWKTYGFWILFVEAVGALSGFLTREGTKIYSQTIEQPPLSPPGILFPIVWSILYALMGISAARIYSAPPSRDQSVGLLFFFAQLFFNFMWSIIFFNMQAFGFAFIWLLGMWLLIIGMTVFFYKIHKLSAWLQIPYLIWVTFAAYLNAGVWWLN